MLPKAVTFGPLTYALAFVDGKQFPDDLDGDDFFGLTVHTDQTIYINNKNHDELSKVIVTHESLHGMFFQTGVSLDPDQEELLCRTLAPLLTSFIRDNPEVVAYIGS